MAAALTRGVSRLAHLLLEGLGEAGVALVQDLRFLLLKGLPIVQIDVGLLEHVLEVGLVLCLESRPEGRH